MKSIAQIEELLVQSLARLKMKGIDQGEILYWETETGTIRTFLNRISHNGFTRDAELTLTAILGKEIGQAHTNDISRSGIDRLISMATERRQQTTSPDRDPVLSGPYRNFTLPKQIYFESTWNFSDAERMKMIGEIIDESKKRQLKSSAKLMNGGGRLGVINTRGTMMVTEFTEASLSLVLTDDAHVSAYSSGASENIESLNPDQILRDAINNAARQISLPVVPLPFKGKELYFDLILAPDAVAEWIETLATFGMNGQHYEEGESFVSGRLGQRVLGENITLYDDPMDLRELAVPFDFEGVPKKGMTLVENGVAKSICYDFLMSGKFHKKSTGHALPPFERSYGAIPRHLVLKGGETSLEEMIASSDDPTLYVTRFHYTNVVNAKECLLTGMTKDGTFLIRNGKFVGPVSNLRFLESIPEALNRVTHLGQSRLVHDPVGYGGLYPEGSVVPALKIKRVRFIGTSQNLAT